MVYGRLQPVYGVVSAVYTRSDTRNVGWVKMLYALRRRRIGFEMVDYDYLFRFVGPLFHVERTFNGCLPLDTATLFRQGCTPSVRCLRHRFMSL